MANDPRPVYYVHIHNLPHDHHRDRPIQPVVVSVLDCSRNPSLYHPHTPAGIADWTVRNVLYYWLTGSVSISKTSERDLKFLYGTSTYTYVHTYYLSTYIGLWWPSFMCAWLAPVWCYQLPKDSIRHKNEKAAISPPLTLTPSVKQGCPRAGTFICCLCFVEIEEAKRFYIRWSFL